MSSNNESHEDVSYNAESLFTSIPALETIDYILHRIYAHKVIEPFCKKSIFKNLLLKLTKECVFSVSNRLIKQIDGCPVGGPTPVVFSDIFVSKVEEDIVAPMKPHFCKRYVDSLFEKLKFYHWNINLPKALSESSFYLQINKCKFNIVWNTKNIRSLFQITSNVKACVCYFLSNFCFSPNDSPSKTRKNVFYFI